MLGQIPSRIAVEEPEYAAFSNIDLKNWKNYDDIITGSLWLLGSRDKTGPHVGDYWGNFVPLIPNQVLRRFTKQGEVVLDLFSGMGTTLIECRHLGRHGIGVELNPEVAEQSTKRIEEAANPHDISTQVLVADSASEAVKKQIRDRLRRLGKEHADCVILHPPYHDIIKFSDDPKDMSNAGSLEDFLQTFRKVALNANDLLAEGRHLALVIGDKYTNSEWIPLGFECMQICRDLGLQLKAINVKDIQGNERGKGKSENLWRYRALKQGLYLFKHEYIMLFRKRGGF